MMSHNVNVNLPAAEGRGNEPISRDEFNQFVEQTNQMLQESLATIQRLSTNPTPGILPAERISVARDPEVAMDHGSNHQHHRQRQQVYVEDFEEYFQDMPIRGGHRYGGFEDEHVHGDQRYGGYRRYPKKYQLNVDIPTFNGNSDIENFLEWLWDVEEFFDAMEIDEEDQVKLVARKLRGSALAWWERTQIYRRRQGKAPTRTWRRMKRMLKVRFLPSEYEHVSTKGDKAPQVAAQMHYDIAVFKGKQMSESMARINFTSFPQSLAVVSEIPFKGKNQLFEKLEEESKVEEETEQKNQEIILEAESFVKKVAEQDEDDAEEVKKGEDSPKGSTEEKHSESKILIKKETMVNVHHEEVAHIYVKDEKIVAVKPIIKLEDDVTVLNVTDKLVMPGGIDPHTHLAVALAGGTTMHIDFVIPVEDEMLSKSKRKRKRKMTINWKYRRKRIQTRRTRGRVLLKRKRMM